MAAQQVQGKSAIITGAGSGLNLALATKLLSKGCNVLLADLGLRPESKKVVESHAQATESRGRAVFQQTDVTSWEQLERMFSRAETEFGSIDIVVAGAGVFEPDFSSFWVPPGADKSRDTVHGDRYAQIDINLTHPIRVTQLAISRALNSTGGVKTILIVSSTNGQQASFSTPVYAATKHAINGFVRSLAKLEQGYNIRVAAVAPGIMRTPMYLENPEKLASIDMAKDSWSEPEDVAEVMVALIERNAIGTRIGDYDPDTQGTALAGGTILEVTGGGVRVVAPYNDPGPTGPGALASNIINLEGDIRGTLRKGWGL
ncbi:Fc.00g070890.m01.CDS01 [Cosmosporella sp. VM-42]